MRKRAEISSLISVAPMIDWTDRHCRYFHRLLAPHALLYTEMISTGAILKGDGERHLAFSPDEHPLALQLGGSDPADLAAAAKIGADMGYDEVNLNCGCPSDRVQQGRFGACLMAEPQLVADCVAAMQNAVSVPVTVKCRIGIDNSVDDSADYDFLEKFVSAIAATGCTKFIIHARKAWLKGLSPKENREIPPLRYDIAARLKDSYPHLTIILNGGITSTEQITDHLKTFDGVMIGREAYQNPYMLAIWENALHGTPLPHRADIARAMISYIEEQQKSTGMTIHSATRHMLGLYNSLRGARQWRQTLGEKAHSATSAKTLINEALQIFSE